MRRDKPTTNEAKWAKHQETGLETRELHQQPIKNGFCFHHENTSLLDLSRIKSSASRCNIDPSTFAKMTGESISFKSLHWRHVPE